MTGFASLPFEIYEHIFDYLRASSLEALSFQDGEIPALPIGYLTPLPRICCSSYPAGQAAILHTLQIPRTASSFLEYIRLHSGEASASRNLSIINTPINVPEDKADDWLDTTDAVSSILQQCDKLEALHITLRAGAACHEYTGSRPIVAPDICRILSIAKGTGRSGKSLLETLASGGWRLRADTLRLECVNSQDLILAGPPQQGGRFNRFISTRHLVISVLKENLNVYHVNHLQGLLNALITYPEALSLYKLRMDSMAFSNVIHTLGPSLRYLAFTWSAYSPPTSHKAGQQRSVEAKDDIIPYLYGGIFNPLAIGTILLSCRNLQEVKVEIVDLLPFRAMRFPASVKRLTLQWHTSQYFFADFFPWLQNHLCLGTSQLEYLEIQVINDLRMRMEEGQDGELGGETRIARLVDDYIIAKAATELCAVHSIKTQPACLSQAWKEIRGAEVSEDVWGEVMRRLRAI